MKGKWFPSQRVVKKSDVLQHYQLNDLETKAALQGDYFNAIQLGQGQFRGRLLIARLNNVTVYLGQTNHPLERELDNQSSKYIFLIALEQPSSRSSYDGLIYDSLAKPESLVGIIPPGGKSIRVSPPHVTNLFWKIDQATLLKRLERFPELADWFFKLKDCIRIHSGWLADRLRADMLMALEEATTGNDPRKLAAIDQVILVSLTNSFALEFLAQRKFSTSQRVMNSERFQLARAMVHEQLEEFHGADKRVSLQLEHLSPLGSKRVIERSFAQCVGMGPLAYARVVRLHDARRLLLDQDRLDKSIGDVAAEVGFWDWSGFTTHYKRQFGELPSETRKRALV